MPDIRALAANVKSLRTSFGETQEDFSDHCGIFTKTLGNIEHANSNPKTETVQKIAAYTDTTVSQLYAVDFQPV